MKETIVVIGTGRMGAAFAARLSALGYTTVLASRTPDSDHVKDLLRQLENVSAKTPEEATKEADIIVFAVPYHAFSETGATLGPLDGKIILDCTNALKMADDGLMNLACESSSGEELQNKFPQSHVIKAFNTVGYHIIANPDAAPGTVTTLLAGNDAGAKSRIGELAHQLGFETADVGPIRQSRYLEGMAALYMTPYLQGRPTEAFEFHLQQGTASKVKTTRAAG